MKLGIGTAQFGMAYGIANKRGQLPGEEVSAILNCAARNGCDIIDTASLYGESEQVIGSCLPDSHRFKIVTKTPHFPAPRISVADRIALQNAFRNSLERMRQVSLYALLIHNADDLLKPNGEILFEELQRLKDEGMLQKIGVSVYSGRQLDQLLEKYVFDVVQLPLNIFDQRLLKTGHLLRLKSSGTEIHVRSAFLQGLLQLAPEELPPSLNGLQDNLRRYRNALRLWQITPTQAPLWFLSSIEEVDHVICGVDNYSQFEELSSIAKTPRRTLDFSSFAIDDENLINPALWKK